MKNKKKTQSELREEDIKRIQGFKLLDDDFMRVVFHDNIEGTELVLNVIFDRNDMKVNKVISQREIKNLSGRSVRLDIHAVDSENRHYDIEIQREDKGAGERRARFNSSLLDTTLLRPGGDLDRLPDSYIIFITERDVRGQNRPIYTFHRRDDETNELFDDGSHIIYVNGAYQNEENRIGQLMHDFRVTTADQMYSKVLAEKVRYFKETSEGVETMCKEIDKMRNESLELGREEGRELGREEGLKGMIDLCKSFGKTKCEAFEFIKTKDGYQNITIENIEKYY